MGKAPEDRHELTAGTKNRPQRIGADGPRISDWQVNLSGQPKVASYGNGVGSEEPSQLVSSS